MEQEINIVGAGAIGLSIASRLASSGTQVRLWTRTDEQARVIRENGILIDKRDNGQLIVHTASVKAVTSAVYTRIPKAGQSWVFLTVKQFHLSEAALLELLTSFADSGAAIVCLQNGLGHVEELRARLPGASLLQAVVTEGALRLSDNSVRLTGDGEIWLEASEWIEQEMLTNAMQKAGIRLLVSKDINNLIFHKLLYNAVINPLTALFGISNGELPNNAASLRLMIGIFQETVDILTAAGMRTDGDEWHKLLALCAHTAGNRSSMLSDIDRGSMTEVNAINGAIVRLAKRYGKQAPLNQAVLVLIESLHP